MHIVGVGTEIVECLRVGRLIEQHGEQFLRRVFTDREILFCQSRRRAVEHFAAHYAAKEAVLKAMNTAWRRGLEWTDIEVREEPGRPPTVLLAGVAKDMAEGLRLIDVHLSIAHCRAYATATAIAVRE